MGFPLKWKINYKKNIERSKCQGGMIRASAFEAWTLLRNMTSARKMPLVMPYKSSSATRNLATRLTKALSKPSMCG